MSLCYIPEGGSLVETCTRTMQGRLLLRPGPEANEPLVGHWFNRTQEWEARRRGQSYEKYDFATRYEIKLQQLPAFQDLSPAAYRQKIADLIGKIEKEHKVAQAKARARAENSQTQAKKVCVMGAKQVQAQHPYTRPKKVKKSPAPKLFYATDPGKRDRMRDAYDAFEAHYFLAAERLCKLAMLSGPENPAHEFPKGSFPRGMPFQGAPPLPMPRTPPTRLIVRTGEGDDEVVTRHEVPTVRVPRATEVPRVTERVSPAVA